MQFRQPSSDCPPRDPGSPRDCHNPAPANSGSLCGGEQSARPFVEEWREFFKPSADCGFVDHAARIILDD
jgi:hypothetical protein